MSTDKIQKLRTYLNENWEPAIVCYIWGITKESSDEELEKFIPTLVKISKTKFDDCDSEYESAGLYPEGWLIE